MQPVPDAENCEGEVMLFEMLQLADLEERAIASAQQQSANTMAIASLLISKGIFTEKELLDEIARCESHMDQLVAAAKDKAQETT